MTRAAAMDRARSLKRHLERLDVPVSIELQTGRTGGWNALRPVANFGHHVASRRSQGLTPFLALVKRGRPDVPGPLCNGYLGFDGRARIITMDWANHPGLGGPVSVPGATIPRNNGRPFAFGWECEGGFELRDWPESHRQVMARCFAATLAWMDRDERSHFEHGSWAPGRKFDRIGYYNNLGKARDEIRALLRQDAEPTPAPQEDDEQMRHKDEALHIRATKQELNWVLATHRVRDETTGRWEPLAQSRKLDLSARSWHYDDAMADLVRYLLVRVLGVAADNADGKTLHAVQVTAMVRRAAESRTLSQLTPTP